MVQNINYSGSFLSPVEYISTKFADLENPFFFFFFCRNWIPFLAIYQHSADQSCVFSILSPLFLFFLLKYLIEPKKSSSVAQLFQNLIPSHSLFINGPIFFPVFFIPQIYLRKLFLNPWGYYYITSFFTA